MDMDDSTKKTDYNKAIKLIIITNKNPRPANRF
jgi:hypothetical protein